MDSGNGEEQEIGKHSAGVIARLAQGQSLAAANQELVRHAITIEPMFGRRSLGWSAFAIPLADDMLGAIRTQLLMAQWSALLLLLGTVSSLVGLGMLRTAQRAVEFGIREALGAQPRR
ncbi:MAG: hypothetical protein IPO08_05205 [Xanthomonadales bacterium]|nr:hypothetical protein [Xanthomonadales bacterium]